MISPMADLVRAVLGHVDRQELIDLAGALIRIPSFKTEETPVALFLEAFFRRRGYDVDLQEIEPGRFQTIATLRGDRKSTRLNSSHRTITYAVFCSKKKNMRGQFSLYVPPLHPGENRRKEAVN